MDSNIIENNDYIKLVDDSLPYIKNHYINKEEEMQDIIAWLKETTRLYDLGTPVVSDRLWDNRYFRLVRLEQETNCVLPESPTRLIPFEIKLKLDKIAHEHLMLSLDKTKNVDAVSAFLGSREWVAMGKMDGLTCSLTYENGELIRAETRGNGIEGEDILHNAKANLTIPNHINYKKRVVIDGEIICTYKEFEQVKDQYKNPRNYAAGSIRLMSAYESRNRLLTFVAWDVIELIDKCPHDLMSQLQKLGKWGFYLPPMKKGTKNNTKTIQSSIDEIKEIAEKWGYPIDGIVFKFNDLNLREELGHTSHHFNNAIAYKFYDELYETKLQNIEWTMGRTGVLTPVAIFAPVDMDGSTVNRASLHNLSIMKNILDIPFKNQSIRVFKANMIIPQVYDAEKPQEKPETSIIELPEVCPVCGEAVAIRTNNDVNELYCTNPACQGKLINRLDHFFGTKGLNAKGISKATFEKLIEWGWLIDLCDIYNLDDYIDVWKLKPGFGEKSVEKILTSIKDASTDVPWERFLCALGIPLIGSTVSKELAKIFNSWSEFREAVKNRYNFTHLPTFGLEKHNAIINFDYNEADKLAEFYITFSSPKEKEELSENNLEGKVFVITGKLQTFKNRAELSADIEAHGGKVTGSVSSNTDYLINNDVTSTSSKNKRAQDLGIPIISEAEYKELVLQN